MYRDRAFLLRHQPDRRFGLRAVPGTPSSAAQSSFRPIWHPRRSAGSDIGGDGNEDAYDLGVRWAFDAPAVEIEKSVADRKPTPKKRGSRVGFAIDPFRRRQVWYESGLEEPVVKVLIAHPGVREIREQQLVDFRDGGKPRKHHFDCVVTWLSGSRSAIAVKYHDDVERSGLRHVLACVEQSVGDACADDFRIVTERHLDAVTIANARLIVSCGLDFDHAGQRAVRACLARMDEEVRLQDIVQQTGMGWRASRAAIALIPSGCITPPPGRPLTLFTPFKNTLR